MDLETIEAHLLLLSQIPRRIVALASPASAPSTWWWTRLLTTWFNPDLPQMSICCTSSSAGTRTARGLLSFAPNAPDRPLLSAELRIAFVLSGLPSLVEIGKKLAIQVKLIASIQWMAKCREPILVGSAKRKVVESGSVHVCKSSV